MPQLRSELGLALGRPVQGYNFASGGTMTTMLPYYVELAYGVDRPRDCIIVVTPRMIVAGWSKAKERIAVVRASPLGNPARSAGRPCPLQDE